MTLRGATGALVAAGLLLSAAPAGQARADVPPPQPAAAAGPAARPIPPPRVPPKTSAGSRRATVPSLGAAVLPDSVPGDLRAAWALRARVGRAGWPEWTAAERAPVVVRAATHDFLVNHPKPPATAGPPERIPGGGGSFQGALERLDLPADPWARLETVAGLPCVPYEVARGRPGTRAEIAALLAELDFRAFETRSGVPVWATPGDTGRVRALLRQPAFLSCLDREGLAMRRAVAAASDTGGVAWARRALAAAEEADRAAAGNPDLASLLAWVRDARRFEGAAQYVRVLLRWRAAAVASGDTAGVAVTAAAPAHEARKLWQERAAETADRTVTGGGLGAIYEVGALYCALLDRWDPNWRSGFFGSGYTLQGALRRALQRSGNQGGP